MAPKMSKEEIAFRKHWNAMRKDALINKLWEMLEFINHLSEENIELRAQASLSNAQYLANCRSVGGVTLPPGV